MRAYREPRQPPSPLRYAALARPTTAPAHSRTVPTALAAAFRADTVTPLPPASTLTQVTGFRYAALAPYLHEPPTTGPPAGHIRATRAPLRPLACPTRHDERHSRVTEMPTPRRQLRFRRSRFSVASPWHEPAANSRASARTRRELPGLSANPPQAPAPRHESAASPPTSARNRRELRRLSTRPPRAVPSEHATDGATPVSCRYGYTPHAGLHIAAGHGLQICSAGTISARTAHRRPHSGRIRAARTSTAGHRRRDHDSRPRSRSRRRRGRGTVDEITIRGPDRDLVGGVIVVGGVSVAGAVGGMSGGSPTRRAWETSARTPTFRAR